MFNAAQRERKAVEKRGIMTPATTGDEIQVAV